VEAGFHVFNSACRRLQRLDLLLAAALATVNRDEPAFLHVELLLVPDLSLVEAVLAQAQGLHRLFERKDVAHARTAEDE
jgi:hypothetical protein